MNTESGRLYGLSEGICGNREADRSNSAPVAGNRGDLPSLLSEKVRTICASETCGLTRHHSPSHSLIKKPGQFVRTSCHDKGLGQAAEGRPARRSAAGRKLVLASLAAELFHRDTVEMTHAEIGVCCGVGERQVRRSLRTLVASFVREGQGFRAHKQPSQNVTPDTSVSGRK
jgi:hypothetical protein